MMYDWSLYVCVLEWFEGLLDLIFRMIKAGVDSCIELGVQVFFFVFIDHFDQEVCGIGLGLKSRKCASLSLSLFNYGNNNSHTLKG